MVSARLNSVKIAIYIEMHGASLWTQAQAHQNPGRRLAVPKVVTVVPEQTANSFPNPG